MKHLQYTNVNVRSANDEDDNPFSEWITPEGTVVFPHMRRSRAQLPKAQAHQDSFGTMQSSTTRRNT